jgi:hypothetical protein
MTKIELEKIKKSKRWTVTFEDLYSRYFFIFFPLAITIIGSVMTISGFKNNMTDLKIAAIIILTLGLLFTFFVIKRLYQNQRFYCFEVEELTKDKVDLALQRTKLNNLKYHRLGFYKATTNVSWFSWGEEITIIIADNEILINSRPSGSFFSFQPITIFKDRQNIKSVFKELQNENILNK